MVSMYSMSRSDSASSCLIYACSYFIKKEKNAFPHTICILVEKSIIIIHCLSFYAKHHEEETFFLLDLIMAYGCHLVFRMNGY